MNHNDESRTIDSWMTAFWSEHDAQSQGSSKEAPRLWASVMGSSSKYLYVHLMNIKVTLLNKHLVTLPHLSGSCTSASLSSALSSYSN